MLPDASGNFEPDRIPLTPRDLESFANLPVPGAAKAAINFQIIADAGACPLVVTETRIFAEQDALRQFATYWRVIVPGSAAPPPHLARRHRPARSSAA